MTKQQQWHMMKCECHKKKNWNKIDLIKSKNQDVSSQQTRLYQFVHRKQANVQEKRCDLNVKTWFRDAFISIIDLCDDDREMILNEHWSLNDDISTKRDDWNTWFVSNTQIKCELTEKMSDSMNEMKNDHEKNSAALN